MSKARARFLYLFKSHPCFFYNVTEKELWKRYKVWKKNNPRQKSLLGFILSLPIKEQTHAQAS